MRTQFLILIISIVASCLGACGQMQNKSNTDTTIDISTDTSFVETEALSMNEQVQHKIKMVINGQEIGITLYDTPTANALYEALPMELSFSDYNGTEKIAYPPETLPTEGEPDGCDPEIGDFCLYAPWGNLCIFYQDFRYSQSLIKLGHVDIGMETLTGMGEDFTITLERMD